MNAGPTAHSSVDVATFSPARVLARGLLKTMAGAPFLLLALFLVWFAFSQVEGDDRAIFLAVAAFVLLFALHVPGGIGRMISSSAKGCYLRAGHEGIDAQIPRYKLFGRFAVVRYFITWNKVAEIVNFTYRLNGIPTTRELQIRLRDGTCLAIASWLFAEDIPVIQQRLLAVQAACRQVA